MFGFIAVEQSDWLSAAFGSATLLGTLGVAGAWLRLAKRSRDLSRAQARFVRLGLACGMAACLILLAVMPRSEGPATLAALLGGLLAAAVIFYAGTGQGRGKVFTPAKRPRRPSASRTDSIERNIPDGGMASIELALLSLEGLSIGDALGAAYGEGVTSAAVAARIRARTLPPGPWEWTDDTHMALSVVEILAEHDAVHQDALAERFAERYAEDPFRGYGRGAAALLAQLGEGSDWREAAPRLFAGGSFGNGAAMRAAPIGAFHAGRPDKAAAEARKSAEITHAHAEGQAGAMAVAVAAAIAAGDRPPRGQGFLDAVLRHVPAGETRNGIVTARAIAPGEFDAAVERLGTGWRVSAQDTVPFCLWCAAHHPADFEEALWRTLAAEGDRDTVCAIVGGIAALTAGDIPEAWLRHREPLPDELSL